MNLVEQIWYAVTIYVPTEGIRVDPDVDVIPKNSREYIALFLLPFCRRKRKSHGKGNIIYENKGKQVSVYGKPSKGEKIVNETSLKTFVSGMENEMSRILAKNPFSSKTPVISDLVWIVGMADAYDAMVSDRSYRVGMHPVKVLKIIEEERGKQFFAPFVDSFKEIVVDYPIGSVVLFRDGCVGVVTEAKTTKMRYRASLFGDIEAIGKERKFASEDVFLPRRIGDMKELHRDLWADQGRFSARRIANFIYAV